MADKQITEFVGLRSKQYAFKTETDYSQLKCKGISKTALKDVTIEDYKNALDLNRNPIYREMNLIRSHRHTNYTVMIYKKVLDGRDEKRRTLENGIDTLPWGY